MTEILSQDEIDQLLSAVSTTGNSNDTAVPQKDEYSTLSTISERKNIKLYDFKRPDKFSKEYVRTVSIIHETFARLTSTTLSAQLRSMTHLHVASVDQLTYEEFIRSIASPTVLSIINMDPLKGSAILEVDSAIAYVIIDKLFGGMGQPSIKGNRELSEIEQAVIEGIIVRILGNMREAWSQVLDLRPRLGQIETNPQFAQIVPPGEMIILVTLEIAIEGVEGMLNLCIPYMTLEPIISKLSTQYWYSTTRKVGSIENIETIQENISNIVMPMTAEVGSINMSMEDVSCLKEGDVINLYSTKVGQPILLRIGNRPKFECQPGIFGRKMAVQVLNQIEEVVIAEDLELFSVDEGGE